MDYSKEVKQIITEMHRKVKIHESCIVRQSLELAQSAINLELMIIENNKLNKELAFLRTKPPLDSAH